MESTNTLNREQTISEFRKMWNWIADETERTKGLVYNFDYTAKFGFSGLEFGCFLCEYTNHPDPDDPFIDEKVGLCAYCPICFDTNNPPDLNKRGCVSGWYGRYVGIPDKNWDERVRVARIIANLPERVRTDERAKAG